MKKWQYFIVALSIAAICVLVYWIHLDYHLPYHMDEWQHLSNALRLGSGDDYAAAIAAGQLNRANGLEIGFQYLLLLISRAVDLTAAYQYLPAIWAAVTAAAVFFVVYRKSSGNFLLGWLAMMFFAAIRSNVNVLGVWFFTPLAFSLPFFLFCLYFFSEGLRKNSWQLLAAAVAVLVFLLPIYPVAVLALAPILLIYGCWHYRQLWQQGWIIAAAALALSSGVIIFKIMLALSWSGLFQALISYLVFPYGWGVLEVAMMPWDLVSVTAMILAAAGIGFIIIFQDWRRYDIFLLALITTGSMLLVYDIFHVSYLVPYQRNLYYFVFLLAPFSALGLYAALQAMLYGISRLPIKTRWQELAGDGLGLILILAIGWTIFSRYFVLDQAVDLYRATDQDGEAVLKELRQYPQATVMAPALLSLAMYPLAHKNPVGDLYFFGSRQDVEDFYAATACGKARRYIKQYQAQFIIVPFEATCRFTQLVYQNDSYRLYRTDLDLINSK